MRIERKNWKEQTGSGSGGNVCKLCMAFFHYCITFSIGFQSWERGEKGADKNGIWGTPHSHREGT